MRVVTIIVLVNAGLAFVTGVPAGQQRIIGGSETTVESYPSSVSLLRSPDMLDYQQKCGGSIINNRALITSAFCLFGDASIRWRIRVGSNYANSGGIVSNIGTIIYNPFFNPTTRDSDIAVVRSATNFVFSNTVRSVAIAGSFYNLLDNLLVTAIGWGATTYQGEFSETLRHVDKLSINQEICASRYAEIGRVVTTNMLCTGVLDVGGRDQCDGDNGSPILRNNVVVGLRSWGQGCGLARFPGVSVRISRFTNWIVSNA